MASRTGSPPRVKTGLNPGEREKVVARGTLSSTEKLVTSLRLRKIEKEHASTGALLDNRRLHDLEDADRLRPSKLKGKEKAKKRELARQLDAEAKAAAEEAAKERELMRKDSERYEMEEKIWKSRSSAPSYFAKRQFERPDLVQFMKTLPAEKRREFKAECRHEFFRLCEKIRVKCRLSHQSMSEIFHPDANAHRTHCQYIMQLYKTITAENIEDPTLEKFKKQAEEEDKMLQEKTQKALNYSKQFDSPIEQEDKSEAADKDGKNEKVDTEQQQQQQQRSQKAKARKKLNTKQDSVKNIPARLSPLKGAEKELKSVRSINSKAEEETKASSIHDEKTINSLDKMKLKRIKIGTTDPRELLVADAERLEKGVTKEPFISFDRNNIVEKAMTDWVLEGLYTHQIEDIAGGYSFRLPSWRSIESFKDTNSIFASLKNAPPPVMTFEDFKKIFDKYTSEEANEALLGKHENEKRAQTDQGNDDESIGSSSQFSKKSKVSQLSKQHDQQLDVVETLKHMDPDFKEFVKLTLRKRPQAKHLGMQSEKLERNTYAVTKTSRVGEGTVGDPLVGGFKNIFGFQDFESADSSVDENAAEDNGDQTDGASIIRITIDEISVNDEIENKGAEEDTSNSPTQSPDSSRANTSSRRTKSRLSSRRRQRVDSRGQDGSRDNSINDILKYKLDEVWTTLKVSTFAKLAFMRKYASSATDFSRAIDLWGEAACGVFIRQQLLDLLEKLEKKLVVHPYSVKSFLSLFEEPYLPASFIYLSNNLVNSSEELPLSYTLHKMFIESATEMFNEYNGETSSECDTRNLIERLLHDLVELKILSSIRITHEELDDVITHDGKSLKDLILSRTEKKHSDIESKPKTRTK